MSEKLKEKIKDLRKLITVVSKFPYWSVKIVAYTKAGNIFDYYGQHGKKPKKASK